MQLAIRNATAADVPILDGLIRASVRGLQSQDYTAAQMERALEVVFGVDSQLIADGTYFVATVSSVASSSLEDSRIPEAQALIVGCGGWSKRRTLYGGDRWALREDGLLDPNKDAAKIRAFFVHPDWARRGIGSRLLENCEDAAITAGFRRLEMGSTLTGVPLYRARGYIALERSEVPLGNGLSLPIVRMEKCVLGERIK
ncbi:MAG TPA: GNAT family N-acetyltransferase [Acidobacteriaceae bacterium]|jgi:GNAT superfamily N-acetyltransferase